MSNSQLINTSINNDLWVDLTPLSATPGKKVSPSSYVINVPLGDEQCLLINGLTGAIDIVSTDDYRRLFEAPFGRSIEGGSPRVIGGPVELEPSTFGLYQRGYFLTAQEEAELVESINEKLAIEARSEPMCFFLAPTNFCAVGCTYCIESSNPKKAKRYALPPEKITAAFQAMKTLMIEHERSDAYILLFGGEPMQPYSFESVKNILDKCRESGLKIFCFTSGISLDLFAPMLANYLDVILGVCVTLDGNKELHNSRRTISRGFELAVQGIELLLSFEIPTMIRTNVSKTNLVEIPWLKEFYQSKGWWENPKCSFELNILTNHGNLPGQDDLCPTHAETASYFLSLIRSDRAYTRFRYIGLFSHLYYVTERLGLLTFHPEELGLHARVPRMFGCPSTGAFTFTLDADGSIRMCNEQVGSSDKPVGHYWPKFDLDTKHVSEWAHRTPDNLELCRDCNHRFLCGGGCSLRSIKESQSQIRKAGYGDISKGICGSLQADIQSFLGLYEKDVILKSLQSHRKEYDLGIN